MLRKAAVVALATLLASGSAMGPAHAYTPRSSTVLFNNPEGGKDARNRSMVHVRRAIESAPKDSVIRIASYSFNRREIADALIAACGRGVTVQMVLNGNTVSGATKRVRALVGTKIDPRRGDACHPRGKNAKPYPDPSFVKVCRRSCRGGARGNQHMKFFLFSRAGTARNVVMVGATNLTGFAANVHWNDLFTQTGKAKMFADYSTVFRQLAEDKLVAKPYRVVQHGDLVTQFGPRPAARTDRSKDPVSQRLNKVRCKAAGGTGIRGRTAVRLMMYAWVGKRGRRLASKVAGLRRSGCSVRAILSQSSKGVRRNLRKGGVPMRTADLDQDKNRSTGFSGTPWEQFTHEKWMSLDGTWAGRGTRVVWTGSENWSDKSLWNDEVTLMIPRAAIHRAYVSHFDKLWSRYTRRL